MHSKNYYVYILTNYDSKVVYVGVTNNLIKRVYQHKNKLADGFTKKYNVHNLIYYESYSDINRAIAREKQIKSWNRAKKNMIIREFNPTLKDLYPDIVN